MFAVFLQRRAVINETWQGDLPLFYEQLVVIEFMARLSLICEIQLLSIVFSNIQMLNVSHVSQK